jgi:hypothetical protein
MLTSLKLDVRLRVCPRPSNECPYIATIPKGEEVNVFPDRVPYDQADGYRARWRKVQYQEHTGWVNEGLLIEH